MGLQAEQALVTGAASGIGRAVALRLLRRGASVLLLDQNAHALEEFQNEFSADGERVSTVAVDVSNSADIERAINSSAALIGRLDTVVCCAGILRGGTVTSMAEEEWHRVIAVNLTGTYLTSRYSMPWLLVRGGSFTAISSDAGVRGARGYSAYCASKHGVVGLVRCLALDYGPLKVRSNVVCPSFVETPMAQAALATLSAAERAVSENKNPLGRHALPQEVAEAVAHLSSPEASYVNGAVYAIDGGLTAGGG